MRLLVSDSSSATLLSWRILLVKSLRWLKLTLASRWCQSCDNICSEVYPHGEDHWCMTAKSARLVRRECRTSESTFVSCTNTTESKAIDKHYITAQVGQHWSRIIHRLEPGLRKFSSPESGLSDRLLLNRYGWLCGKMDSDRLATERL